MTIHARLVRSAAVALTTALMLIASGCGTEIDGRAMAETGMVPATASAPPTSATSSAPPTAADEGGDVDVDVEIGECVRLGGTVDDATVAPAPCGSEESNYRVVGKVPTGDECVSDADQYYYELFAGQEQGALCLDIDFVSGGCMDLGDGSADDDPRRIACDEPATDGVRVGAILLDTVDVEQCDTDFGRPYRVRNFIVCYDEL